MQCQKCGAQIESEWQFCQGCGQKLDEKSKQVLIQKREYKVVEKKLKSTFGFSRLEPLHVEQLLNDTAKDGWIFDKHIPGETLADKDTIMFVFYRER